ncbi:uncharacterized protein LOC116805409 [Drosophila grimshawi]|uniref:uncharacterized protein LOC116805409 n=1 Tax=Drosophila grimshawi TaxID=7222 RepID=UPI000C86F0DD|nr:uncharacterized protein LOC116805409 [Drosophila grimshawi]
MWPHLLPLALAVLLPFLAIVSGDSCSDCSLSGGVYACVDEYSYGICFNMGFVVPTAIKKCPTGYYCNVDGGEFCTPIETSAPSCVTLPINADAYCANLKKEGYFRVESDSTCKDYIHCYKISGEYLGWLINCNTNEYFNSQTSRCETQRPDDC